MIGGWPWEAWLAVVGLLATHLVAPLWKFCLRSGDREQHIHERGWERTTVLEEEISLLRKALHRQSTHSNVYSTISELLILAMPLPEAARITAVKYAREIAERALSPPGGGGSG